MIQSFKFLKGLQMSVIIKCLKFDCQGFLSFLTAKPEFNRTYIIIERREAVAKEDALD